MLAAWKKNKPIPSHTHNDKDSGKSTMDAHEPGLGPPNHHMEKSVVDYDQGDEEVLVVAGNKSNKLYTRATVLPHRHTSTQPTHNSNTHYVNMQPAGTMVHPDRPGEKRPKTVFARNDLSHTNISLGRLPHRNMSPGTAVAILQHWAYHGRLQPAVEAVAKMYNSKTQ